MLSLRDWKDLSIAEQAEQMIQMQVPQLAGLISCRFDDGGILILTGCLAAPSLKLAAERVAANVDGVTFVENRILLTGQKQAEKSKAVKRRIAAYV